MLSFISDCDKNQRMCAKAVDNYFHALKVVPDCYKTQEMCKNTVGYLFVQSILETQSIFCSPRPLLQLTNSLISVKLLLLRHKDLQIPVVVVDHQPSDFNNEDKLLIEKGHSGEDKYREIVVACCFNFVSTERRIS